MTMQETTETAPTAAVGPRDDAGPVWPAPALPRSPDRLIGRAELLGEVVGLLSGGRDRVIALVGTGGVGKTRLAAEAIAAVLERYEGRVAWVALGSVRSVDQATAALAAALGLGDVAGDRLADELGRSLDGHAGLVILDGGGQLPGLAAAVAGLLDAAAGLRVLVTGPGPLGVDGELIVHVEPLDLPAADGVDDVRTSPAVQLLLERAGDAGAAVRLTPRSASTIARIVRRLDGLPLALELGASMLRLMGPHQLLDRLEARIETPGAPTDRSHELLDAAGQRLFRRLGVFSGAFTARDAADVLERSVAHGLAPTGVDVVAGLDVLVRLSLVRTRPLGEDGDDHPPPGSGDAVRYQMLATVRDDALRRLEACGEATAARWAHANHVLEVAEEVREELAIRSRVDLLARLDAMHDDLLACLEQARAEGEGEYLLRLAGALAEYWRSRGRLAEGRLWLDAALRLNPDGDDRHRARALHGSGMLANWQSDFPRARALLEEALATWLRLGELAEAAATLNQLVLIGLVLGDLDDAERLCRQGLEIRRSIGDEAAIAASLNTLGGILQFGGRRAEAQELFEESLAIRRRIGDDSGASVSLGNLALVARDLGRLDEAAEMLREAIATRERLGDRQRVAVVRHNYALVLFERGDLGGARGELETALAIARDVGDRLEASNALSDLAFVEEAAGNADRAETLQAEALALAARIDAKGIVAQAIDGLAGLAAARGQVEEAATLWAAAETIRRVARYALLAADRRRLDGAIAIARDAVDDETWWRAWATGETLTTEEAIARATAAIANRPGGDRERPTIAV
jgi:predicted ATPase